MSNDPICIPLSKVVDFLRDIGLDPLDVNDLRSVHFEREEMTVVRMRRGPDGAPVIVGNGVATETTTARIDCE